MHKHAIDVKGHQPNLQAWFDFMLGGHSADALSRQLHDDVVFESPVVHTPQKGKAITMAYLVAAGDSLGNPSFKYVDVFDCGRSAVLEFETQMDGVHVNGVDIIKWDENGLITEFKVMVRPLKAVHKCHEEMGKMLEKMKASK